MKSLYLIGVLCLISMATAGHMCIHDKIMEKMGTILNEKNRTMEVKYPVLVGHKGRRLQNLFQSIRITFDTTLLESDPGWKCTAAGDVVTSATTGEPYTCTASDILTGAKKSLILSTLLPAAKTYFSNALSVLPLQTNLMATPLTTCGNSGIACCAGQLPSYLQNPGVENTDLVILVTSRPTLSSTIAWAVSCQYDQYGRPLLGHINFGPRYLSTDISSRDKLIAVCIHELTHVLGFSEARYSSYRRPNNGNTWGRSQVVKEFSEFGKQVSKIITPTVVSKAKEQFGCFDWPNSGLELEDNGGPGTAGSHWEKRLLHDEYMTGTAEQNAIYSALTLALFEDMGWYSVNFANAQTLTWGKDAGCVFVKDRCSSWTTLPQFYCTSSLETRCTHDRMGVGYCNLYQYSQTIPSQYSYFENPNLGGSDVLADYCPYIQMYGNKHCRDKGVYSTLIEPSYGESISDTSLCFMGTFSRGNAASEHGSCHEYECTNGRLKILIGSSYVTCPVNGGSINVNSYNSEFAGIIECPVYSSICTDAISCPNMCSSHGSCTSSGICECLPGYEGTDCSSLTCPTSSDGITCSGGNNICDHATGLCNCVPTRGGSACEENLCDAAHGRECNGHGTCGSGGNCICDAGFTGRGCDEAVCPNNCTSHGTSTGYYTGVTCSTFQTGQRSIPLVISTVDDPYKYTNSVETNQFQFYDCMIPSADYKVKIIVTLTQGDVDIYASMVYTSPSPNQFTWLSASTSTTEVIEMDPFVTGSQFTGPGLVYISVLGISTNSYTIEVLRDPCSDPEIGSCSGRGTCLFGTCECDYGWTGTQCEIPSCLNNCNNHGNCVVNNSTYIPSCECTSFWVGEDCSSLDNSVKDMTYVYTYGGSYQEQLRYGLWGFYSLNITDTLSGLYINIKRDFGNTADMMLLVKYNDLPTIDSYDFFDISSWSNNKDIQTLYIDPYQGLRVGTWYIGVYCSRYSKSDLSYRLDIDISKNNCPSQVNTCNGHGSCSLRVDAPSCTCQTGYYGSSCEDIINILPLNTPISVFTLKPGDWYFGSVSVSNTQLLTIQYTEESNSDTIPLVLVKYASKPTLYTENFMDYDSYNNNTNIQIITISGDQLNNGYYYISIHNRMYNTQNTKGTLLITLGSLKSSTCVASDYVCGVSDYSHVCSCRGQCIMYGEQTQCKCMQNWKGTSCNSPVLYSIQNLQKGTQSLRSLCSICNATESMIRGQYSVYKIDQPLYIEGKLSISVNGIHDGNPDIFISEQLPRSIYDFTQISTENSHNETVTLSTISSTGLIYLIIYANTDDNYNVQINREIPPLVLPQYDFVGDVITYIETSVEGTIILVITILFLILFLISCCCTICGSDSAKNKNMEKKIRKQVKQDERNDSNGHKKEVEMSMYGLQKNNSPVPIITDYDKTQPLSSIIYSNGQNLNGTNILNTNSIITTPIPAVTPSNNTTTINNSIMKSSAISSTENSMNPTATIPLNINQNSTTVMPSEVFVTPEGHQLTVVHIPTVINTTPVVMNPVPENTNVSTAVLGTVVRDVTGEPFPSDMSVTYATPTVIPANATTVSLHGTTVVVPVSPFAQQTHASTCLINTQSMNNNNMNNNDMNNSINSNSNINNYNMNNSINSNSNINNYNMNNSINSNNNISNSNMNPIPISTTSMTYMNTSNYNNNTINTTNNDDGIIIDDNDIEIDVNDIDISGM
ncbi:hypothetical protein WA158_007878 [Blastocystis sp. Blastoise]